MSLPSSFLRILWSPQCLSCSEYWLPPMKNLSEICSVLEISFWRIASTSVVQLEVIRFRFQAFELKVFCESGECCPLRFGTCLSSAAILWAWPGPILSCKRHHGSFFWVHSLPQWEREASLLILFHSSFFVCQFWTNRRGTILFLGRLNLLIFQT